MANEQIPFDQLTKGDIFVRVGADDRNIVWENVETVDGHRFVIFSRPDNSLSFYKMNMTDGEAFLVEVKGNLNG